MISRSGETRISDERLAELIENERGAMPLHRDRRNFVDRLAALRELAETRREGWVMVPSQEMDRARVLMIRWDRRESKDHAEAFHDAAFNILRNMLAAAPKEGT